MIENIKYNVISNNTKQFIDDEPEIESTLLNISVLIKEEVLFVFKKYLKLFLKNNLFGGSYTFTTFN